MNTSAIIYLTFGVLLKCIGMYELGLFKLSNKKFFIYVTCYEIGTLFLYFGIRVWVG